MNRSNDSGLLVVAVAGTLLLQRAAMAAFLGIDDRIFGQISVGANDWEIGLSLNGSLFQQGIGDPANTTIPGEGPITFSGSWIDLGLTGPLTRTVYFVEPSNPLLVSDILNYSLSSDGDFGTLTGDFTSAAVSGGLGPLPGGVNPANVHVEGTPFFFDAPFFQGIIETTAVPCPWDCGTAPNGVINTQDFLLLLQQWGLVGASCDFDNNGVNATDFLVLLAHWGPCPD